MKCWNCEGCGRIANDEEGNPWTYWEKLPEESKAAVRFGIIKPVTCDQCNGTGEVEDHGK